MDAIIEAETLSDSSKTQYLEKLTTLSKLVGKPLDYILDNPHRVRAIIERRYQCALTQRAFVAAVKAVFHYNPHLKESKADKYDQYTEFQNQMSQAVTDRYMAAEPSDKERQNWVPWNEVLARERELAASEFGSYDHLLLAMYCLIEPLRQDYGALRILIEREPHEGATGNYLVLTRDASAGKLVLNTYKTAKKYGRYERALPENLLAIIKANLLANPRAYLFVDENGEPYRKSNSFTQFSNRTLKRLFKKNFTVSLMRHSHISNIDFNASTPGELFQKSRNMAHSISTQQLYRRRVEPAPPAPLTVTKHSGAMVHLAPAPPSSGLVQGKDGARYLRLTI